MDCHLLHLALRHHHRPVISRFSGVNIPPKRGETTADQNRFQFYWKNIPFLRNSSSWSSTLLLFAGCAYSGPSKGGWSGTLTKNVSNFRLNDAREKFISLKSDGKQLKSLGPLTANDLSLSVLYLAMAPLFRSGISHNKPLLPLCSNLILKFSSARLGTRPYIILKVYRIKYLSLLLSREYKLSSLSRNQ